MANEKDQFEDTDLQDDLDDSGAGNDEGAGGADEGAEETVSKARYLQQVARAKKAEAENKKLKGEGRPSKPTSPSDSEQEEILDLRIGGYSRDEIKRIHSYAKANGISVSEAANDEFVKAGIDKLRSKNRTEEATPKPSGRVFATPTGTKKSFAEMSREERIASFPQVTAGFQKKGSGRNNE